MAKMIKEGEVALCSACNKLSAAALECECTLKIKDEFKRKLFRKTFPRNEYNVASLVEVEELKKNVQRLKNAPPRYSPCYCGGDNK